MRVILTIIAVALVTLLTGALIVPYFVDWTAHRAEIAERLEAVTGGPVTLTGPVALRLLPTPYLEVGAGSVAGAGPDAPTLTFEGARLELAPMKLASGAFRFTDVRLQRPVLTLARRADGALILPVPARASSDVGFDRFSVADGTLRVAGRARAPGWTIAGVRLEGDAPSLAGPWRVSGEAVGPRGAAVVFRLASERVGPAGAPVRVAVEAGPLWPALEFEGILAIGPNGPSAAGAAVVTGASPGIDGPAAWRAAGKLEADLDGASLTNAEFRFGPEERALRAEGSAALVARGPAFLRIEAKAKEANLDALFRRKGEDSVTPARAIEALSAALAPAFAGVSGATIDARLAVATAILGGDTLGNLAASLQARPGKPLATRFELGLPGSSRLRGDGEVETGPAAKFTGAIDFSTEDAALLGRWAGQGSPEFGVWADALADALPARNLAVSGDVEAAAVGFSGKRLTVALGRSVLTGSLAFTRPVGADPGRIFADLAADSLEVETLPSLGAARSLIGGYDLSLSLSANALHVARVGDAGIDGASLIVKLGKTGAKTTLDRFSVAGLGGASVEATGAFGPDGATASGRLSAEKLADFAALAARLAPGPWSKALVQRAPLLSPASVDFEASLGPMSGGSSALQTVKATGTLERTRTSFTAEPSAKGDGEAMTLVLDAPDSGALMRQLGLEVGAQGGKNAAGGPGHVELRASGGWGRGFDVEGSASLAGSALIGRGRYAPSAEGDEARLFGSVRLAGANVAPLASVLGLAPPGGSIGPADASADLTLRGERWNISRIAATASGVKVTGDLSYEPRSEELEPMAGPDLARAEDAVNGPAAAAPAPPAAVSGALTVDRLRLADLASLALGPSPPASAGALWSNTKFAAPPLVLPSAALRLNVGALSLMDGLPAQGFSTELRVERGRLDLEDFAMTVASGRVSGRATLRRSGGSATLDGAVGVDALPVRRGLFAGRVGGHVEFASTGGSAAALIAGLAGGGAAEFSGATLARSDPGALERVLVAAQAPDADIDESNVAFRFGAALDKGALAIPDGTAPLSLSAGTVRLGPVVVMSPRVEGRLDASLDLARMRVATRLQLTGSTAGLAFWAGPAPSAAAAVEDALGAPKRRLDVAALSAGLATQAIARETDRIANLEADIRERAFFNRRLKGERFLDRRAAEIEDWRAEQERLRGLAEHLADQRAEAARLAAEKAAAEKAAAEKAAAEKAAAEKAAAEKAKVDEDRKAESETPSPEKPEVGPPEARISRDALSNPTAAGAPTPPPRPKPSAPADRSSQTVEPVPGALY